MRTSLTLLFILSLLFGYGQRGMHFDHDYGKVKEWNNPKVSFTYTNTTSKEQLFLPISYSSSFSIHTSSERVAPGESVEIEVQYFTEQLGRFSEEIDVYVSTLPNPIVIVLQGKIVSLHPDAVTICPRVDNAGLETGPQFVHRIRVIDKASGEPVVEYHININGPSGNDGFMAYESVTTIKPKKPGFIQVEVDKEGYRIARTERYVSRYTKETLIELEREVEEEREYFTFEPDPTPPQDSVIARLPVEDPIEEQDKKEKESVEEITNDVADPLDDDDEEAMLDDEVEYFDFRKTDDPEQEVVHKEDTTTFDESGRLNPKLYQYNQLVFLIDVSGSMEPDDKLPLLKQSMMRLMEVLREEDRVTIITYSSSSELVVKNIPGNDKITLYEAIGSLQAKGHSYGEEGLRMAYEIAEKHYIPGGNNEIILASDGMFNSKYFNHNKVYRQVASNYRRTDVHLSTIGFGHGIQALDFMEKMARRGKGSFIHVKKVTDTDEILVNNMVLHSRRTKE